MTLSALDTELIKILLWVVADLLVALIAIWQSETQICRCKKMCYFVLEFSLVSIAVTAYFQIVSVINIILVQLLVLCTWKHGFHFYFEHHLSFPWHVLIIHSFIQDMLEEGKDFLRQPFYRWRFPKCIFFKNWA